MEENEILVGKKPLMNYVKAIILQLNLKGFEEVFIKARGEKIVKAIDLIEVVKEKKLVGIIVEDIVIGSHYLKNDKDEENRVSYILIKIRKT